MHQAFFDRRDVRPGCVISLQTFGGYGANFNLRAHALTSDGVFSRDGEFLPLPVPDPAAVTALESQSRYITRPALAMDALEKLDDGTLSPGRIASFMRHLEGEFAAEYNRRKGRRGAFWSERYHSILIEDGIHFWSCLRYIDLNTVRAGSCNTRIKCRRQSPLSLKNA